MTDPLVVMPSNNTGSTVREMAETLVAIA